MKRILAILFAVCASLSRADDVPDDVGDVPGEGEAAGTGTVTRTIEWLADQDVFEFAALPFVTNTVSISTGTIWDCQVDLLTPSGAGLVLFTNTAAGGPATVRVVSTTVVYRAFVVVRGLAEYTTGTYQFARSPVFPDADGDGLPDSWEIARFGTTTNMPETDADGDGLANRTEYLTGSDPADAASGLRITGLSVSASNGTTVSWQTIPHGLYRLDQVSSLAGGWTPAAATVLAVSNSASWPGLSSTNPAFYRIELLY